MAVPSIPTSREKRKFERDSKYGSRLRRQLGSDVYRSTVSENGRERTRHLHAANWTEARRTHEKRLVNVKAGVEPVRDKLTVDELAEIAWETFDGLIASGERAATTLVRYQTQYRVHIAPVFGHLKVQSVRAEHVSRWLAGLRRKQLDVASIYSILRLLLNLALERGLLVESPLKRLPKVERPRRRPKNPARRLDDSECSALIEHALPGTRTLIALYAFTGLRQSEGLGLTWEDIDLEHGRLHVRKQLTRSKPARRVPPKSERGVREVELLPELAALLRQHKTGAFSRGHARPENFVFCTSEGRPLYYRNVTRDLVKAADRAGLNREGIPRLSTHDLRHTAISRWVAAGIDPVTIARMAGDHTDVILKTYAGDFARADRAPEILAKLDAGTRIQLH